MQGQWSLRKAVLLLAEDSAQGNFREFPEFIITCSCRYGSGVGASDSEYSSDFHPDLVIRKGSLILEISNSASDELLSLIGGLLGAE